MSLSTHKPSAAYLRCLEAARRHHLSSKTYSGKFLRPHAPSIKEIIDRLQCTGRILDYGCGKGEQYRWVSHGEDASIPKGQTLEEYWGMQVVKFDPAWPPYSVPPNPNEHFDLVLCTHTLGSVPCEDLGWVVDELIARSIKALYIAEKIGPVQKRVFSEDVLMPRWSAAAWEEFLRSRKNPFKVEITLATREVTGVGVITKRVKL